MSESFRATIGPLPGVVGGEIREVDLSSYVGETALVLVFYPSGVGGHAGQSEAILRAFTGVAEQVDTDVTPVGIAAESVYSQRRFAEESGLSLPLLSDQSCDLIRAYGVAETRPSGQTVAKHAVAVVDYRGMVVDTWTAPEPQATPPVAELQSTLSGLSPTKSARSAYRLGYTVYREGRRHLSRGLEHCEEHDWSLAATEFGDTCEDFATATDEFIKSQDLAGDEIREVAERGRIRATKLWQASEWLAGYAAAAEDGDDERKRETRREAQQVLQEVRELESLPEPRANPVTPEQSG